MQPDGHVLAVLVSLEDSLQHYSALSAVCTTTCALPIYYTSISYDIGKPPTFQPVFLSLHFYLCRHVLQYTFKISINAQHLMRQPDVEMQYVLPSYLSSARILCEAS